MVHTTARRSLLLTVCLLLRLTALGTTQSGTRRHQESRGVAVVPSIPPASPGEHRVALLKGWSFRQIVMTDEQLDGANMVRELHRVGHPRQSCATTQPARPSDSGHVRMRTACAGGRTGPRRISTPTHPCARMPHARPTSQASLPHWGTPAPWVATRRLVVVHQPVCAWPLRWHRRGATRHAEWGGAYRSMPGAPAGTS